MIRPIITSILLFWIFQLSYSQDRIISGFVSDGRNGEKLIGCNVYFKNQQTGTTTDANGYFNLEISGDEKILIISYVGYKNLEIDINQIKESFLLLNLVSDSNIPEVSIHRTVPQSIQSASSIALDPRQINKMPSFFGERDLLRTIQFKPGVQTGKEGSTGLIVRGGGPDQNQFLIDGVPLYYINHLGNLLSSFNPDAVNTAYFIKGAFPAYYGGRLSSITDIRLKDGNKQKYTGSLSFGTIAMKGTISGPINENTTFLFSGRRCNLDILTRALSLIQSDGKGMAGYSFYDANLKVKHQLNDLNTIYLTLFSNKDRVFLKFWDKDTISNVEFDFKNVISWGNHFASLRYHHIFNNKHSGVFSLSHSYFHFSNSVKMIAESLDQLLLSHSLTNGTAINETLGQYQLKFFLNNMLQFHYGVGFKLAQFSPFQYLAADSSQRDRLKTHEMFSYIEASFLPFDFIKISTGLRYTLLANKPDYFIVPEPRISIRTQIIPEQLSVSFSYSKMSQFSHMVSDNSGGIPVDIWLPANEIMPPEVSNQISLGIENNFPGASGISINIEAFYKKQINLLELKPGNNILYVLNNPQESIVNNGTGTISGVEFTAAKEKGRLTGWTSYMYINNIRQFDIVNNGNPYPYIYDKPHNFKFVLMAELNSQINLSCTWQLSSGNLFTLPIGKYSVPIFNTDNKSLMGEAHLYGGKNSTRLNPYHRLDISIDFYKKLNKGSRIINVGLYNAYNKQNPFFLFYSENESGENTLHQLSLFPVIPSISYRYDF